MEAYVLMNPIIVHSSTVGKCGNNVLCKAAKVGSSGSGFNWFFKNQKKQFI